MTHSTNIDNRQCIEVVSTQGQRQVAAAEGEACRRDAVEHWRRILRLDRAGTGIRGRRRVSSTRFRAAHSNVELEVGNLSEYASSFGVRRFDSTPDLQ